MVRSSWFKKKFTVLSVIYLLIFTLSAVERPVFAQTVPAAGLPQIQELITRLINISVTLAFMALTVWLVWSAIKFFITSGGDPKALAHAWGSVTWAFMGLFFMVLAYLILKLIVAVTGAEVTSYCLGFPPYCI